MPTLNAMCSTFCVLRSFCLNQWMIQSDDDVEVDQLLFSGQENFGISHIVMAIINDAVYWKLIKIPFFRLSKPAMGGYCSSWKLCLVCIVVVLQKLPCLFPCLKLGHPLPQVFLKPDYMKPPNWPTGKLLNLKLNFPVKLIQIPICCYWRCTQKWIELGPVLADSWPELE